MAPLAFLPTPAVICCLLPCIPFGFALMALWIWMIVEVCTKEPEGEKNRMLWILIVIILNWPGALAYFMIRRPERVLKYGR